MGAWPLPHDPSLDLSPAHHPHSFFISAVLHERRKPADLMTHEVTGCATGSARYLKRPSDEGGLLSLYLLFYVPLSWG